MAVASDGETSAYDVLEQPATHDGRGTLGKDTAFGRRGGRGEQCRLFASFRTERIEQHRRRLDDGRRSAGNDLRERRLPVELC